MTTTRLTRALRFAVMGVGLVLAMSKALPLALRDELPWRPLDAVFVYLCAPMLRLSTARTIPSIWADDPPFAGLTGSAARFGLTVQCAFWFASTWWWSRATPRPASRAAWIAVWLITGATAYWTDRHLRIRYLRHLPTCDDVYIRLSQDLREGERPCAKHPAADVVECLLAGRPRERNPRDPRQLAFTDRPPESCQVQVRADGTDEIVFTQVARKGEPARSFRVMLDR